MDALHDFVAECDSVEDAVAKFDKGRYKQVECPGKEVCAKCSAVLKALGFSPSDTNTVWGSKNMGSGPWGASQKVQAFLKLKGVPFDKISSM